MDYREPIDTVHGTLFDSGRRVVIEQMECVRLPDKGMKAVVLTNPVCT